MESDLHLSLGSDGKREVEPTFFFMLNCLLYSRLETGFPSNHDFYDEDVNVYLANLLCSFMKPEFHRRARRYLSPYDTSLFEKIENSADARLSQGVGNYYLPAAFGGGVDLAIRDFQRAVQLDPKSAEAYLWLGIALRKAGRNAEARAALQKSLDLNPNRAWAKKQLDKTPAK